MRLLSLSLVRALNAKDALALWKQFPWAAPSQQRIRQPRTGRELAVL